MSPNSEQFQDFCIDQARRMGALEFYPRGSSPDDAVARGELVKALMAAAASEEHARRIIDRVIEVRRESPSPLDLTEIAAQVPSGVAAVSSGCPHCEGRGYVSKRRKVTSGPFTYEADFSHACECRMAVSR